MSGARTRVAVGDGPGSECDLSCESAAEVLTRLDRGRYDAVAGLADRSGLTVQGRRLDVPVFVKPVRAGSRLGTSRVGSGVGGWDELAPAVRAARRSDPKVLVEKLIRGRKIDIGVLKTPDGVVRVSPPRERSWAQTVSHGSLSARNTHNPDIISELPAWDQRTHARLDRAARQAFAALDCAGLLRVGVAVPADVAGGRPALPRAARHLDPDGLVSPARPYGHELGGLE